MNRIALEFQNKYLEKQYQKKVSDHSSRLLRRILVGYFVFYVIPEIADASINSDYSGIDSNDVLSIIGYLMLSVCYLGLTKKKELFNYICLVAHISILLTSMLGMIKHTKQNNRYMQGANQQGQYYWIMQNIFQYSAIQVGLHFIISLISSSIKIALAAVAFVYTIFIVYIIYLVGEDTGTSKFTVVMIVFAAFIVCQMYFIHYNHKMRRQNFLHQFNDKQFTNILKNGLNQNIFFVSYNQTLNNIDIWFSNKSCEKYFSSQNKGEFKKFSRSVYLQEQVSTSNEEFYFDGTEMFGGKLKKDHRVSNNQFGSITDELSLDQKKKSLQQSSKDKNAKLENVIIELIKTQIKKQKHKNYYDFSQFKNYLAIQKEDVIVTSSSMKGGNNNSNNNSAKQEPIVKEKLFQFKINTFIRNSCFNACIIFNEEEWDKYNGLYKDKCSLQLQKQQDFIQMLQPVIQKMEPYAYLHQNLVGCINQCATLLNNMLLYNLIIQNKYDNRTITVPDFLGDFSLNKLLDYIISSNSIFFPIKYEICVNGNPSEENLILHSNQKRVAQILQNFILEIGKFVNVYRRNSQIDTININAQQIKGDNNLSNIIKFNISFTLLENQQIVSPQSILLEENEEDEGEEGNEQKCKERVVLNMDNEGNDQNTTQSLMKKDKREGYQKKNKLEATFENIKQSSNSESEEEESEDLSGNKNQKKSKQDKAVSNQKQAISNETQLNQLSTQEINNESQSLPKSKLNNLKVNRPKHVVLPSYFKNKSSNSKDNLFLEGSNSPSEENTTPATVSTLKLNSNPDNQGNKQPYSASAVMSLQNMLTQAQGSSGEIIKQKPPQMYKLSGNEGILTSVVSENNTNPTNKWASQVMNINSNTALVGNSNNAQSNNFMITSPSNNNSNSIRDPKIVFPQQLQLSNFRDYKINPKNEDIESGLLMKFEEQEDDDDNSDNAGNNDIKDIIGKNVQKNSSHENSGESLNQSFQVGDVTEVSSQQLSAHQKITNYQFESKLKITNSSISQKQLIPADFIGKEAADLNQLLKPQNINKQQPKGLLMKQQGQESSYNADSSKGFNNSNQQNAYNMGEDSFSFQYPNNLVVASIKNVENAGYNQNEIQKSSLFGYQQNPFRSNAIRSRNGSEGFQVNQEKEVSSIYSPLKNKTEKEDDHKNPNLVIFKDEEDSKNSSNDQNKNVIDSSDNYSMKKRNTSHFAVLPSQSVTSEANLKPQTNNSNNNNPINFMNVTKVEKDTNVSTDEKKSSFQAHQNNIVASDNNKNTNFVNNNTTNLFTDISDKRIPQKLSYDSQNNKSYQSVSPGFLLTSTTQNKNSPAKGFSLDNQRLTTTTKTPQSSKQGSANQILNSIQSKEFGKNAINTLDQSTNIFSFDNQSLTQQQKANSKQKGSFQQSKIRAKSQAQLIQGKIQNMSQQKRKLSSNQPSSNPLAHSQQLPSIGYTTINMIQVQIPTTQPSANAPPNVKQIYQEPLKIMKSFKPDQDLGYQRLNCLNLQVNAKLICALGPTNDILVNEKNEFSFYLYQDMRILHTATQQFQNNYNVSLTNFNDNLDEQSIQKQVSDNKSQLNISVQRDIKAEDAAQDLSESQLSKLLTSNHQGETCVNPVDKSYFSPGKIFRNLQTQQSNNQY